MKDKKKNNREEIETIVNNRVDFKTNEKKNEQLCRIVNKLI